jgi:predicted small lipoprotein YifL
MKRVFTLLLVIAMGLGMAACGGGGNDSDDENVATQDEPEHEITQQELREFLISDNDVNDIIIETASYVGRLCKWGEDMTRLTEPQKIFYYNQMLEMEVNNGGISQYFLNLAGMYSHETVDSLKAIEALKTAEILQKAINRFPDSKVPKGLDERRSVLGKMQEKDFEIWDQLDDDFYEYEDNLNELNLAYIRKNIESFF